MKLQPYKKIIAMTKDAIDALKVPIRAKQMRQKAELEISKMEETILTQEGKIQDICTVYPIDFDKLINAQDELALLERRKKQLTTIVHEMFPEIEE